MLKKMLPALSLLALSSQTQALTFSFDCITNNTAANCSTAESYTQMNVNDLGDGQVEFVFSIAPTSDNYAIADIYFYGDILQSVANIENNSAGGVTYLQATKGSMKLPGIGFGPLQADFNIKAAHPAPHRGVNPGEELGIIFNLASGNDFSDVIAALTNPFSPTDPGGSLLVGFHAIAFDGCGSESLVHVGEVPLPSALWLFASGLLGLSARKVIS